MLIDEMQALKKMHESIGEQLDNAFSSMNAVNMNAALAAAKGLDSECGTDCAEWAAIEHDQFCAEIEELCENAIDFLRELEKIESMINKRGDFE